MLPSNGGTPQVPATPVWIVTVICRDRGAMAWLLGVAVTVGI
jgi:hypothetical protein